VTVVKKTELYSGDQQVEYYSARERYRGQAAVAYDEKRTGNRRNQRRWNAELACVDEIMNSIPEGSRVLDIPCGTGRFFPKLRQKPNMGAQDTAQSHICLTANVANPY